MKITVPLPKKVDAELAAVVEDQGVYATEAVTSVSVNATGDAVEVEFTSGDESVVRDQVATYLKDLVTRFRKVAGQEVKRVGSFDRPLHADVFEALVERGWAIPLGNGQVGISGRALEVFAGWDRRMVEMARSGWDAEEQQYPALIPTSFLHKCNYFTSFPHLVSMVSHFAEDYKKLKEVRDANADTDELDTVSAEHIVQAPACFTPATCYHCYQGLIGKRVPGPGKTYTAIGRCARYESANMIGLDRLWDFSMRELIFVGGSDWVTEQRDRSIEAFTEVCKSLDLSFVLETATDPFFAPIYANKSYWQGSLQLKFEARFPVTPERTMSCTSFNLHQDFFGSTFDIALDDGTPVSTGCVGIGVDRLVLAYFIQHGVEDPGPMFE